ncbi:hypothetical protein F4775DRAFT_329400 [Biscogniauxia sp. FL1348]|nr:hypothetical protein F4775DRAFT_329400 [Biscogniauxia sp. FL1348]
MDVLVAKPTTQLVSGIGTEEPRTGTTATGRDVRLAARSNRLTVPTSGLAATYLQANLLILPSRYAADFRLLCARNPVPCPLMGESVETGAYDSIKSNIMGLPGPRILADADIRRDAPRYNVYHDAKLVKQGCLDITEEWTEDHVAFLVGCSFSFETALIAAGLTPRHTALGRNVPMYRTTIPLCPAGVFTGSTYVVSMRSYKASDIERVRDITRGYNATHGEPIAWGWDALQKLGIVDIDMPQWGDSPLTEDGRRLSEVKDSDDDVPVFWGCGVTPQEAVMVAGIKGTVMAHAPGHMLLLDCTNLDIA